MKRLFLALLLVLLLATSSFAVGTVAITYSNIFVDNQRTRTILTISWVADAAAATVPSTTIPYQVANRYNVMGWYLYSAETNPGSMAPTDNYDIVINDADSVDISGGLLANRDTANSEIVNIGTSSHGYPVVRGDLTFVLSNNSVNSATGTCILTFIAN